MKFEKYMAIYRNDDLTINDDEVTGIVKDVKEYFKYELAHQCMSFSIDYENLIFNGRLILDLLEELENEDDNKMIEVKYHPMGTLYYEEVEK